MALTLPTAVLPAGISAVSSAAASSTTNAATPSDSDLFTYLIAEMQNQDPTDPTSADTMTTQLASLQVAQEVSQQTTAVNGMSQMQALSATASLIGQTVTISDPSAGTVSGQVSSVTIQGGNSILVNVNGTSYPSTEIQEIQPTTTQ